MNGYDGTEKMKVGKENEEKYILPFLEKFAFTSIKDVRSIQEFRTKDIDFLAYYKEKEYKFEAKSCKWISETSNLFFETHRFYIDNASPFYEGWGWRSRADILLVRNPINNICFRFYFEELKDQIKDLLRNNDQSKITGWLQAIRTEPENTNLPTTCLTFGYKIPMKLLHYQKYIIDEEDNGTAKNVISTNSR